MKHRRNRGSILLIAIGTLALLTIYAVVFFSSMALERNASRDFVMGIKAENVAKAGLERAIADLKNYMVFEDGIPKNKKYRDRNWDRADDGWRFPQASLAKNLSLERVESTDQLSFPKSKQKGMFGDYAYSGLVGNTISGGRDLYRLKVLDCSSMIYLNSANPINLIRILQNLCEKMGIDKAVATELIRRRPGEGYKTKRQLQIAILDIGTKALGYSTGQCRDIFLKLRDKVTCYTWVDRSQIRPLKAKNAAQDLKGLTKNDLVLGCVGAGETEHTKYILFEPRAPININTATPEVLYAVLKGIEAGGIKIDGTKADRIVTALMGIRGKSKNHLGVTPSHQDTYFSSITQFYDWCKTAFPTEADLLMANFNPNVDLNKFSPDSNMKRTFDKTDLEIYSTEACFNSMGFFEITSLGSIMTKDGKIEGTSKVQAVVKIFNIYRDTTQTDFETDRKALGFRGRHLGIISLPEFSNARQEYQGADNEKELRPINLMCNFDGQLMINGLIRKMVLTNDFLLGFIRNEQISSGIYIGSLKGVLTPNNFIPDINLRLDNYDSSRWYNDVSNKDESLFNPGKPNFFEGNDLVPLGVMIDSKRKRYLAFSGDNMPTEKGTISLWVKANKATPSGEEYYFYWGNGDDNPAISIYRKAGGWLGGSSSIVAHFNLGWSRGKQPKGWYTCNSSFSAAWGGRGKTFARASGGVDIEKAVTWAAGSWHNITVTFGKFSYGGALASEGRLYVDGVPADFIAPFATTATGNTVYPVSYDTAALVAFTTVTQQITITYPAGTKKSDLPSSLKGVAVAQDDSKGFVVNATYGPTQNAALTAGSALGGTVTINSTTYDNKGGSSLDPWQNLTFYIGARLNGGTVTSFANATIDNVLVHHYIHQDIRDNRALGFEPYSRYSRPQDPQYPNFGTTFRKRLYPLEKQDITLGNIYWTTYPSDDGGIAYASLEVNGKNAISTSLLPISQKEGAGYGFKGAQIFGKGANKRVYYLVDFQLSNNPKVTPQPLNSTPIFDDITVTYFSVPETLAYYKFDE